MARIDIRSNGGGGGSVAEGVLQLENGVAMDSTLRSVTDQNNTTSPLKLSTTAVQVNSPLRITTSDASGFYLDAEDSATNNRFSIKRDPSSQEVTLDFASNPSGSTSLVGAIRTYGDGVNLSNAMSFREDGHVGIGTDTPGAKFDVHSASNTVAQFNRTGTGNSQIQHLMTGAARWTTGFVSATGNYSIFDNVNSVFRTNLSNTGRLTIGNGDTALTGVLNVKGSGSTSATTSLLVQNSAGTNTLSITDDNISTFNGNINFTGGSATTQRQILFQSQGIKIKHNLNGLGNNTFIGWNNDALPLDSTTQRSTIIGFLNQGNVPSESTIVGVNNNLTDYVGGTTTIFGGGIRLNASSGGGKFIGCDGTVKVGFNGLFASDNGSVSLFPPSTYVYPQAGPTIIGAGVNNSDIQFPSICLGQWASDSTYPTGIRNNHLSTTNGSGTNVEGYNLHIMPGRSTGNATPKDLIFNTTNIGSSGTSYQTYVSRWWIKGGTGTLANTATPNASAALQADSTTQGFLPPRMTNAQRLLITTPAVGLMVYCTDAVEGLYVYKSTGWTFVI
jgi:hypothetical protein